MNVNTTISLPKKTFPILIIGTGGIVRDAHLPAYRIARFPVWGLYNRTLARAEGLANEFGVERVFDDLPKAISAAGKDMVYDLALPASMFADVLRLLPEGAHVLIQKPMGESMANAREILDVCRQRKLRAAINCQLRFAPFVMAARDLVTRGVIALCQRRTRLDVIRCRPTYQHIHHFITGVAQIP